MHSHTEKVNSVLALRTAHGLTSMKTIWLSLLGLGLLAACDPQAPDASTHQAPLLQQQQTPVPVPIAHAIDWASAAEYPRILPEHLSPDARAKLAQAPLPALLPDVPEVLEAAIITQGPHWYAASVPMGDYTLYVSGTRLALEIPGLEPPTMPLDPVRITRNELIVNLTFDAFGASYTLELECDNPTTHPVCTRDDTAMALYEALALANGGQP